METRTALYVRISKTDPSIPKVEIQEKRLRAELVNPSGYEVIANGVYVDDGIGASSGKPRPEWQRLLADIKAGKIDVVCTTELERLDRYRLDNFDLQTACIEGGAVIHAIGREIINPADPDGEFMSTLGSALGRREAMIKAKRQRNANRARVEAGLPLPGRRPFGWTTKRMECQPIEAEAVRWGTEAVINGASVWSVMKHFHSQGLTTTTGRPFTATSMKRLLTRPRNAGLIEIDGDVREGGQWEAIVSPELFQQCCAILATNGKAHSASREPKHLLAGIVECYCGHVMRSNAVKIGTERKPVYICGSKFKALGDNTRHPAIRTEQLDALVRHEVIAALLAGPTETLSRPGNDDVVAARQEVAHLRLAQSELIDAVGEPGVTMAKIRPRLAKLAEREAALQEHIDEWERANAAAALRSDAHAALFSKRGARASVTAAAKVRADLADRFDALPLDQRRLLVRTFVKVTVDLGRNADRVHIEHIAVPSLNDTL